MNCPKCQIAMRTVDREGVHIDQCTRCRGVFLDAGELEQILAAEERWNGAPPPYEPPQGPRQPTPSPPYDAAPRPAGGYRDSPPAYRGGYRDSPPAYGHHGYGGKRKRSFLESLFD